MPAEENCLSIGISPQEHCRNHRCGAYREVNDKGLVHVDGSEVIVAEFRSRYSIAEQSRRLALKT